MVQKLEIIIRRIKNNRDSYIRCEVARDNVEKTIRLGGRYASAN